MKLKKYWMKSRIRYRALGAEKEQIKFHKATKTKAHFMADKGIIAQFFASFKAFFRNIYSFIR